MVITSTFPITPLCFNLYTRPLCYTLSNVLDVSKNLSWTGQNWQKCSQDFSIKNNITEVKKARRICRNSKKFSADSFIDKFSVSKEFMKAGSYFIFVICKRCLYSMSAGLFSRSKDKESTQDIFPLTPSFDNKDLCLKNW